MSKTKRIIYWIATLWLSLGMVSSAIVQLIPLEEEAEKIRTLGYAPYFLTIIGIWKLLGVIAVLTPRFPLVKEWAYAGFFFLTTGAVISHLVTGDPATELFGPGLLLILTVVSWIYRPADRKLVSSL